MYTNNSAGFERQPQAELVFSGVQINSRAPERLIHFYESVFGGSRCMDSKDRSLRWHAPGYPQGGPILSVRSSRKDRTSIPLSANDHGYAHICFEAEDVGGLLKRLEMHGGRLVSTLDKPYQQPGIYATDPDGNLIEIHLPFPTRLTVRSILHTLATLLRIRLGQAHALRNTVRFIHVNVVVPDWRAAVDFYQRGLGAVPTGRLRNYRGPYIGKLIGIPGSTVCGRHVALPGYGEGGPTFEVFTYNNSPKFVPRTPDQTGIRVTEFLTSDMATATSRLLRAGATPVAQVSDAVALLQDPQGNFIRLLPF